MLRTALTSFSTRMPTVRNVALHQVRYNSTQPASATSALSFKKHLRQRRFGPVPAVPEPTVEDAVTNILYNTPAPSKAPETRHILNCLVQNEPGVLSRLSGILAARGFNIESLVVANTEVPDLSRMTVVFNGRNVQIEQARRQLEDLVPVWAVLDYTKTKLVERELLLIKVSILGPEHLHEQLPTAKFDDTVEFADENLSHLEYSHDHKHLTPSETLRETFSHLRALTELTRLFDGKVVDVSSDSMIVELCAKPGRIDSFMKLCKPFGVLEASRTGVMAMPRSPVHDHYEPQTDHSYEENDAVDATMLPPG
ncbi:small subunit of acetolactate synthase-domain-containing protein [Halteromyces radiatus]|uniref:small subunit of acetolactate synthase-domain-containing protein n=1 Tax=Halteromyces radiatus TaxID=101107 RepID=UPI00221EF003|nr:small subunit of acetolactate synthase-domain-containing protein [Halteromyces radiatus]KAI8097702.1 small subunit of acetolactate synthase-domain-containing protein [Halteromyces radiatus]